MENDDGRLMRIGEVAQQLSLSRSATYELVSSGVLPSVVVSAGGRSRRVRPSDLRRFIDGLNGRSAVATGR